MLKRIRQLHISLAAKCQLLFGTAVVLIIAAALFVPWQRMEQLTTQLDLEAAGALADHAVPRHVLKQKSRPSAPTAPPAPGAPATQPAVAAHAEPRLLSISTPLKTPGLSPFD